VGNPHDLAESPQVAVPVRRDAANGRAPRRDVPGGQRGWFTANLVIKRPGRYSIDYDYDNQPDFFPPLNAHLYALDFDYFSRTPENTPAWLKRKLDEAAGDEPPPVSSD
jgi:hypothetical protein